MRYTDQYSVGLTGGIGSGKTTASEYFIKLGATVIDADEVSRLLTAPGEPAIELLSKAFGDIILSDSRVLNRNKLRKLVFNNPEQRRKLERILHPLIHQQIKTIAGQSNNAYIIFTIPLLAEADQKDSVDRVLVIDAPDDQRIKRIQKRSGLDKQTILRIMQSQASRNKRLEIADDVINNNDNLENIYRQVERLHEFYLKLSDKSKAVK